jgi:hypothetical protein
LERRKRDLPDIDGGPAQAGLVPNLCSGFPIYEAPIGWDPVNTIASRQGAGAGVDKIVPANTCPVTLSQPPLNPSNSICFKNLYSFVTPLRCIFACENATRDAPKNQLRVSLEQARRHGRLVQFLQLLPNAKELHRYSATDTLFVPIVEVGLIKRLKLPQARASAQKNPRPDQRSSFDIALSVSPLRQADRHVDHGAVVRIGQQSRCRFGIRKPLAPIAAQIYSDPSTGNSVYANERRHLRVGADTPLIRIDTPPLHFARARH